MTIAGHHTVAELREWLDALDYQIGKMAEAYSAFAPFWTMTDPATFGDWSGDWAEFQKRYASARSAATTAFSRAQFIPIPDSSYPVEDEWQGVHFALKKNGDGAYVKGDLQDLYNRLATARGAPIDMSKTPRPHATDVDLGVFNGTGAVIQAGKDTWNALPSVKVPEPSTGTKWLLGGGLVLGLALVARSVTR